MPLIIALLQQMSVFVVIAYLFTKSPAFRPLTSEVLPFRQKLLLYLIFSSFSILGTYFGLPVKGAIANTRAIGPVLAGIIGGPGLGLATGLTGGLHRYALGGFTALSCGISTTLEGLIGGLVHRHLTRHNLADKRFSPTVVLATTFAAEALQMIVILLLSRPWQDAYSLVSTIALPMILANSVGAALFISIIRDQKSVRDRIGVISSAKALKIAEKTLDLLSHGFNRRTATQIASVIYQETGVGAVAISDTTKLLAFIGQGADHHLPGDPVQSPLCKTAMQEKRVVFADGHQRRFTCTINKDCPLGSALIVPLMCDEEVVGTIKLYEPKQKLFLNINRALGEGLAHLFSNQLLRSRFQDQKNLLLQSELRLAQAQINPHFLFNALNTIRAIVARDGEQARSLLLHLSTFLRKNLKRTGELASLAEEVTHVQSYLKIEEARFADRLQVSFDIDPALEQLQIPVFTLQPLVENAVKHGIANLLEGGRIAISARLRDDFAEIIVEDNAASYCEEGRQSGIGIALVDKRIRNLYGPSYGVSLNCRPNQWTRACVRLPKPEGQKP
ncbi:signal transduction histidine kinase LytS [Geothermobacter ehrlichii]|uniref:histidine kinase n=1 Tax=Geothermobacter ehrlichii TaxID=213224 RepID=A0A5D3WLM2_9BACT|nr:sensor histidine kinase [Geothermobacter ehrlichii]TYO98129.1 signal transduction histidine kinase LytS [Geothermobacter ehrlichii]